MGGELAVFSQRISGAVDFEVDVTTGGAAGGAHQADGLAPADEFPVQD